jgi:pimeloyl-ACP methyl ester carboxylesterase
VKTRRVRIAAAYLALLAGSHLVQVLLPVREFPADLRYAEVGTIKGGIQAPGTIRLAYRDTAPGSSAAPVVLVHGSPGSGEVLRDLAGVLNPRFRVIVPDLPGFGASTRAVPDYSLQAHSAYVLELLDALHVPQAQLLGYSMGGGVVLSAADRAPARVRSLVLLSAVGVQEEELTGRYGWNHGIHGMQLAALWSLWSLFPHFGSLRALPYTVEYARNFYDSDQRPLREILERYRGRMLILHGTRDRKVPIAAAREHHRLVPQSELIEFEADHSMAFRHPEQYAEALTGFLASVH